MRVKWLIIALLASAVAGLLWATDDADGAAPLTIGDILSSQQIASIAARRAAGPPPPGVSYVFAFKDVPGYGNIEVHYLIEEVHEGTRTVRRIAPNPSAVVYVLQAKRYSDIRTHLNPAEFADALEQMLAVEKAGDTVRGVKIRRALFDIGDVPPADFLKNRAEYYDSARGIPSFEQWPEAFRNPAGRLGVSVVNTEIWRSGEKTSEIKTLQAKQFFGYLFPVLDELFTTDQKQRIADDLRRSNVRDGIAPITLDDVRDYGHVRIEYLVRDGKPLAHPTAMISRVTLSARAIAEDPMIVRKYLAPEGANYLLDQVRAGVKAGRKLQSVEITRVLVDVAAKGTAEGDAAHAEFKKNIADFVRQDFLIRPETWPDRFRNPDGKFDVELTTTSLTWKALVRE